MHPPFEVGKKDDTACIQISATSQKKWMIDVGNVSEGSRVRGVKEELSDITPRFDSSVAFLFSPRIFKNYMRS